MEKAHRLSRREQLEWLKSKKGSGYLQGFEYFTDQEVQEHFDRVYPLFQHLPYLKEETSGHCDSCGKPMDRKVSGGHPFAIDLREFADEQWI